MASVTPASFHAWLTASGSTTSATYSAALLNAYCAKNSARDRGLFWFVANNERMKPEALAAQIEAVRVWAEASRTKAAKAFLKIAN